MGSTGSTDATASQGQVSVERLSNGVAIVRLGAQHEKVVTFTVERMESLKRAVEQLKAARPKGVVFIGPSEEMFTAGADINLIKSVTDAKTGQGLARTGQLLFDLIESLECPTVAAISGPCVGGGCEMVLACTYRIATDSKRTTIGLPETKLGIIPGFGGTQRLPRLVGLPAALDIILAGKTLKSKHALAIGLVDKVVRWEQLETLAVDVASGTTKLKRNAMGLLPKLLTFTGIGRNFVKKKSEQALRKQTKGFYPAPPSALATVLFGLEHGIPAGMIREAEELGRMIVTPECKALVNIFFLTEASKGLGKGAKRDTQGGTYAVVVGAGAMGAGIAGLLARNECNVILKDRAEQDLDRGIEQIKGELAKSKSLSEADRSFVLNRIERTTKDSPNIASANLAIEAIFEEMSVKKTVLGGLAKQMTSDAIIATNTSSLSVTEIASSIPNPARVVGMHFFNPVAKMPLVEIVRAEQTSDRTIAIIAALTVKLGKFPIVVKDVPGFLVNRILSPYLNETAFLIQDGYEIRDIDKAALSFGMPMGPVRLLDEVGLDVAAHVANSMLTGYGDRMKSPPFAKMLAEKGRKGKKSKAGFYDFNGESEVPHPEIRQLLGITAPSKQNPDHKIISTRLVMSLVNEAVRCLDEGVAGAPSVEAANQIDLGTVMGFGFPPFRGGVLFYAESLGAKSVHNALTALAMEHGQRFEPCKGIAERARSNRSLRSALA